MVESTISCSSGIYGCYFRDIPYGSDCANYDGDYKNMEGRWWILILSCLVMCAMAFGMGSNDAANAWGTSVGSGAISLRNAVIIGAIMEFLGAVTLGYGVSDTIQKGVSDVEDENCWACGYCDSNISLYQAGMFGALISTALFLLLSSFTSMPVSATHAVVGGVVGMTWAGVGSSCLNWAFDGLGGIVASWVISPLLSGFIGALTFLITEHTIFKTNSPKQRALNALPIFVTLVTFVMTFLICLKSPVTKTLEIWIHFTIAFVVSILSLVFSLTFILPWTKKNLPSITQNQQQINDSLERKHKQINPNTTNLNYNNIEKEQKLSSFHDSNYIITENNIILDSGETSLISSNELISSIPEGLQIELKDAMFCFRILLVCNAALESFSHGANDTANCTGPFRAVFLIFQHGFDSCHDPQSGLWIMVLAGGFVGLGVLTYGKNVIETIGKNLTSINYQRGFCIEFSSCVTVVLATMLELPISTTHCQIGSVVFVGLVSMGSEHVAWKLVGKIFLSWIITLPFSGTISILIMELVKLSIKH